MAELRVSTLKKSLLRRILPSTARKYLKNVSDDTPRACIPVDEEIVGGINLRNEPRWLRLPANFLISSFRVWLLHAARFRFSRRRNGHRLGCKCAIMIPDDREKILFFFFLSVRTQARELSADHATSTSLRRKTFTFALLLISDYVTCYMIDLVFN